MCAFRSSLLSPSSSSLPSLCLHTLPYLITDYIGSWNFLRYLLVYMKASYSSWDIVKLNHPFVCQKRSASVRLSSLLSARPQSPGELPSEAIAVQGLEVGKDLRVKARQLLVRIGQLDR